MQKWILFFLWPLSSFAVNTSDWTTQWPYVNGVPVINLCTDGEVLKSIEPLKLCVDHTEIRRACASGEVCRTLRAREYPHAGETLQTEILCNRYETETAEFQRERVVKKCLRFETANDVDYGKCLEWDFQKELIPLDYTVDIYRHQGDRGLVYSHSTEYSISQCF